MQILCTVDIRTRELYLEDVTIAAFDHLVDDVLFVIEPIDGFQLETSTIKIAAVGPLGEPHDYEIDPSTVTVDEETGNINFVWSIPVGVTAMPLTAFKISDTKNITFAVCAEIVSGDNLVKAWHSDDGAIKVKAHLEPESGGGEDPSEEATNAQKIAALQRQVGAISSGAPPTADSTDDMDPDESTIYINTIDGYWYYWNGSDWIAGGEYGANIVDDTVSEAGMAAEAAAVRAALNAKADVSDLTSVAGRVTAVEGDVEDIKSYLIKDKTDTVTWTQGSINNSGKETEYTTRIKSDYIEVNGLKEITCDADHYMSYAKYNDAKVFQGNEGSSSTKYRSITPDMIADGIAYIRIIVMNNNNSTDILPTAETGFSYIYNVINPNLEDKILAEMDDFRDEISDVVDSLDSIPLIEGRIEAIEDAVNIKVTTLTPSATVSGVIKADGSGTSNSNYHVDKYSVGAGTKLLVDIPTCGTGFASFTWQNGSTVSSRYLVGDPHIEGLTGTITVPAGATWLMVSLANGAESSVQTIGSDGSIVKMNERAIDDIIQSRRRTNYDGGSEWATHPEVLTLLHFSDIHCSARELARIMEYYDYAKTYINDIYCTGDMVDNIEQGMSWWDAVDGTEQIITCIGNHEVVSTSGSYPDHSVPQSMAYSTFFAPYIDNWGCTYESGKCYFYKDYTASNIRVIVLHNFLYKASSAEMQTQVAWLEGVLDDARTNGLSVLAVHHFPVSQERTDGVFDYCVPIECAFTKINGHSSSGVADSILTAVQNFIDAGGDFICHMHGHIHFDFISYHKDYPDQLFVGVVCAKAITQSGDMDRIIGQRSQDAFNIFSMDVYNHTVKIVRIGADADQFLRHRRTLVMDYHTKQIISQS